MPRCEPGDCKAEHATNCVASGLCWQEHVEKCAEWRASRVRASGCASHEAGQHCGVPCPAPLPADCWRRGGQVPSATFQGIGRFFTRPAGSMGEEVEALRIGTGYCCAKAVGTGRQVCDECASFDPGFDPLVDAAIRAERGVRT